MTVTLPPGTITTVPGPVTDFDNLVPLLTTFTPSDSCEGDWVYDLQTEGTVWKDRDYNTDYAEWCQPFNGANTFYRPGICPSGQEIKSLDVTVEDDGGGSPGASWYVGLCCSSGYKLSFRDGYTDHPGCVSALTPPVVATVTDETATEDDMSSPPTTTIGIVGTNVVGIMEPVNIVWNEDDLTYFSAPIANSFRALMGLAPLPTTTTGSASSALPPAIPASTSTTDDPGQDGGEERLSRGLSDGAKAGIGIGAVAFVVLLVTIYYLACIRRRRKREGRQGPEMIANTGSNEDILLKRRSRMSWILPWRARRKTWSIEKAPGELHGQDTQEIDGREAGVAELQDTQMAGRDNPVCIAQWHTELQGTTLATQSHMPAELESQPLKSPS